MEIIIDGKRCKANNGETIMEVAKREGIYIPSVCHLDGFKPTSSCRICLVELVGLKKLVTSCSFLVYDGLEVVTNSEAVLNARKTNIELMLSNHDFTCGKCVKEGDCELEKLAKEYRVNPVKYKGEKTMTRIDDSSDCIIRDDSRCILCKRCVRVCKADQNVGAICEINRGFDTRIGSAFDLPMNKSTCVGCGQCVMVCPTGALRENLSIETANKLLNDKSVIKVVASAPAVRVALTKELKVENAEAILPSLLKALGFDKVYDISFGADLTVMEESKEFMARLKSKKNLPLFTSCCPAWINYQKEFYDELKNNVSSCKSPLLMLGNVVKTYMAEKENINASQIKMIGIMPCTAKKGEIKNEDNDVDLVLTVRELLYLIKKKKIDINKLKPTPFDNLLGESSGAGVIFGTTGGVMEASLRTVADKLSNKELKEIEYKPVRGLVGVKTASVEIAGKAINVAVVSGLKYVRPLIDKIHKKQIHLHFVEVMACEGGCINGGGMPYSTTRESDVEQRMRDLYKLDTARQIRKAHDNPEIKKFYDWQNINPNKAKLHNK